MLKKKKKNEELKALCAGTDVENPRIFDIGRSVGDGDGGGGNKILPQTNGIT